MKLIFLLVFVAGLVVGCGPPKAPAMKRSSDSQLDERYLKEVFVPLVDDQSARTALSNSVSKLEEHVKEFRLFMNGVEVGKIPVTQGFKGDWLSYVKQEEGWIAANYAGRLGAVVGFQKHQNQDPFPLLYGFCLNSDGRITGASTLHDGFSFDERGRVTKYWYNLVSGVQVEELTMGEDGKIHYRSWHK
jgi:hypothetical protein